jgi:oxygen-dependent protoporphyrinogen oxidase
VSSDNDPDQPKMKFSESRDANSHQEAEQRPRRIAIVGGGIAGLAAAYELEKLRRAGARIEWTLFEASNRLGGIVETVHRQGFVIECGPDAWVTDKPWARELAIELGLAAQIIPSSDAQRKTYIAMEREGADSTAEVQLLAMPDGMRMMVPTRLEALDGSELFSETARAAYAAEPGRAEELKQTAPAADESVSSFVRRHFGDEVLEKIGAPLLSGVFGGDVDRLSVRSVMSAFVSMEREHGSLIRAVQIAAERRGQAQSAVFTTLRSGLGTLIEAMHIALAATSLRMSTAVSAIAKGNDAWSVTYSVQSAPAITREFDHVLLAAPVDVQRSLLSTVDAEAAALLPQDASSAVIVALAWRRAQAQGWSVPPGFGLLVPQQEGIALKESGDSEESGSILESRNRLAGNALKVPEDSVAAISQDSPPIAVTASTRLLAATFVDQKFPDRTPEGARLVRVYFGGRSTEAFAAHTDEQVATIAEDELRRILNMPGMPPSDPELTVVRRWPRSLPQYEVGHMDRMAALDGRMRALPGLSLLGNGYRGVGLPDLIRDARQAARRSTEQD